MIACGVHAGAWSRRFGESEKNPVAFRTAVAGVTAFILLLDAFGCEKSKSQTANEPSAVSMLKESWTAYVHRFVQSDGRVIDYSASGISTSEGQAYAMLRAVWIGDRGAFDKTFIWARNNLNSGIRNDHLWAWKWG